MTFSITPENAQKFENQGRFLPTLDRMLDSVYEIGEYDFCSRALAKAYFLTATTALSYFNCGGCGVFSAAVAAAGYKLDFTPATVALAVTGTGVDNQPRKFNFSVDDERLGEAKEFAKKHKLSSVDSVKVCLRIGMGLVSVLSLIEHARSRESVVSLLSALTETEFYTVACTVEQLETQLRRSDKNVIIAAERVRNGLKKTHATAFGREVLKQHNRLIAAGHHKEVR